MPLLDPLLTVHPFTGALRQVTPDLLAEVYLAPRAAPLDISGLVGDPHWAWADSHAAAPRETAAAVETALFELVAAVTDMDPALADPAGLPPESRAARHLGQLGDLWRAAGGGVPETLGPLRHALSCRPEDALDALPVLEAGPHPGWTEADRALLELLRQHHGRVAPQTAADELARLPGVRPAGLGPLGALQSGLLTGQAIDGANLRLFGLRDAAAEAEFAAALAQDMLERGTVDAARDIAILLPGETAYVTGVAAAFQRVGIPLSGLPGADDRDIGGEAMRHLLSVLRPGASPTARASLMLSPLMPWDRATGVALARQAMGNRVPADPDSREKTLLGLLKPSVKTTTELSERLRALAGVLDPPLTPRLHALAAGLAGDGGEVPWRVLLDAARPNGGGLTDGARTVEGVSVLRADRAPWRAARQLIVLGLAGDRYPTSPGVSPFFLDGEIAAIRASCGIHMRSRADRLAERMELMRRQLSVASDGIVGLVPRRDMSGARLHPAPLVTLLARCLTGGNSEALIEDVPGDPAEWPFAGEPVPPAAPRPPPPASGQIALGRNLLFLRTDETGQPKPQSPSRLDTMLVSPLAWLLAEIGAEDLTWHAEVADALSRGSIAHATFEQLFPAGPVLEAGALSASFDAAFDAAVADAARFYDLPDWAVDRRHLAAETARAARAWRDLLESGGITVAAAEEDLVGEAHGLRLRGKADALLTLADGRTLVVDYKSGGSRRRRQRMQAGWDLQAQLYMDMLGAMGRDAQGIGYFCLGDATLLAYAQQDVPGAERIGDDVAREALDRMSTLLAGLRLGTVPLNRENDAKTFDRYGIGAYALDASPLVGANTVPGDDG